MVIKILFFKTKLSFNSIFFKAKTAVELNTQENVFLKVMVIKRSESTRFALFKVQSIKCNDFTFNFSTNQSFKAKPLVVFKTSFKLIENRTDSVFEKFNDKAFIYENSKFILDTFNNYFHLFYRLDTKKDPVFLFRFLTFLKERQVSDFNSFQQTFRDFKGDLNGN